MIFETVNHRLYNAKYGTDVHFDRWSVAPLILIGGSIMDAADWKHLQQDLNVGAVINVETEHSDLGKGIRDGWLCEARVPDDGTPFPLSAVTKVLTFAKKFHRGSETGRLYVHCQMGSSRSPAFAYGILRYCYQMTPAGALQAIRDGGNKGTYGEHPYHTNYLRAIEEGLAALWNPVSFPMPVPVPAPTSPTIPERKPIMEFTNRLVNRKTFPTQHVIVCEDDLNVQAQIAAKFAQMFEPQGCVQVSFVPGAVQAAAVILKSGMELILLDHDMPFGNGIDLLAWLKSSGFPPGPRFPVITFSGIEANNDALMAAGATHRFNKSSVLEGAADEAILKAVNLWIPPVNLPSL